MRALYKLHADYGRMGALHGTFTEEQEKVEKLINSGYEVYFGEVLGKHSDVSGPIEEDDITLVTSDPEVIKIVDHYALESGYNPFDYIDEDDFQEHLESETL